MKIAWNENSLRERGGYMGVRRGHLFDANGMQWSGPITWCDTETGEIERYVMVNGKRTGAMEVVKTAAPLRYVLPGQEM